MKKQSLIIGIVLFIIVILVIIVIINKFRSTDSESFNDPIVNNDLALDFLDNNKNIITLKAIGNSFIKFSTTDEIKTQIDNIINNKLLLLNETKNKESISIDKYTPIDNLMSLLPNIDNYKINTILIWNNDTLPSDKWVWCDGQNNTPDLRYRFPLGNNNSNPETAKIDIEPPEEMDNKGIITIDNIPEHTHEVTFNEGGEHDHGGKTNAGNLAGGIYGIYKKADYSQYTRHIGLNTLRYTLEVPINHTHNEGNTSTNSHQHTVSIGSYGTNAENIKPFLPKYSIVKYIIKIK
jgi:hypothetical protein